MSSVGDRTTWYENVTGGSTGEPLKLLQDPEHRARIVAIQEVYSHPGRRWPRATRGLHLGLGA